MAGGVDQRLLALKQKMGVLPAGTSQPAKQLGSGDDETVAAEIEDAPDEKKTN